MPVRAQTPCRHPGCAALVSAPGYCDAHQSDRRQWDGNAQARRRRQRRALPTNSAAWRALREQVLSAEPLCRHCATQGLWRAATVVDHIDNDPGHNATGNLQPLCAACHNRKTAREDGGFGNGRRPRG